MLFYGNIWYNASMGKNMTSDPTEKNAAGSDPAEIQAGGSRRAVRVSVVNLVVNIIVFAGKLVAGIFSHSTALISDAIHSASDVLDTIVVMAGVKLSARKPDKQHPYGYERMEGIAALILAVVLFITGATIGLEAGETIVSGEYRTLQSPGTLALITAICCTVIKECMYWYTRAAGKALSSGALMATAWHSRADALSSLGALAGIIGARMGLSILDPLAGIGICIFVCKVSYDIFRGSVNKLVDKSAGEELSEDVKRVAGSIPNVNEVLSVKSRIFGNRVYLDIDISAAPDMPLAEAEKLRETLKNAVLGANEKIKDCTVQIFPSK